MVTSECDAKDSGSNACTGTLKTVSEHSAFRKQPLSEATLEALKKLVERGGVAGHAAQEMLNAELLGADEDYAARITGIHVTHSEPVSWLSRAWRYIGARIVKR